jgi:hypothetical protein
MEEVGDTVYNVRKMVYREVVVIVMGKGKSRCIWRWW